ncbi:3-dehydroquinate dehydratase [Clostridium baratii]|uniref:ABC transporter n=1 Tax=Clostridium baratii TaxID=1561 RepID=A0A174TC93_9CLOT|nr:ABC transporter ATP-binding protein [Clostridium baratii]OPF52651.1 3-dehydroquinate dehydratase [Clostridium baratii]OPF56101.1 3-dehydroquinate dehydratase [Clostridium baratii]OPF58304.1 3-dehydroquinate dehydratase [Clostridium baratii]OPF59517.1 3-dehydroquinate dehydratase [Clostridium baratii]CUQ06111.1 ABC transporter [Clostridium baratii]
MITYKNVSKIYNKFLKAVDNLNLEIQDGKVIGLLGHNGAGKTTTIKMTVGIYEPSEGEILINGQDIFKNPMEVKRQIGFVPDSEYLNQNFTGYEHLNFIANIYGISKNDRIKRIKELGERFELLEFLNNKIKSYSKGMKQKLVVIASLLNNPKVWILDEPLNGLDPKSAYVLKGFIREYADKGNTVIFSTHVLEVAEKLCDELIILKKSELIFNGTIDELKAKYSTDSDLEEIFLNSINTMTK